MTEPTICACCGQMAKGNTPEEEVEALREFEDLYGLGPVARNDCAIVCDPCFQKFYAWMFDAPKSPQEVI